MCAVACPLGLPIKQRRGPFSVISIVSPFVQTFFLFGGGKKVIKNAYRDSRQR